MIFKSLFIALGVVPATTSVELQQVRHAAQSLHKVVETTNRVALDIIERQQKTDPDALEDTKVREMRSMMASVLDRRNHT